MFQALAVAASLVAALATPTNDGLEAIGSPPPSEKITMEVVSVNGSGCPAGTVAVAPSEDNTAFTVTYSNYTAMVGVGAGAVDFRKNCQLSIKVKIPSGFTYAVAQADFRGYGYLAKGATGLERANYYFMGTSPSTTSTHNFTGPMDGDWQVTDKTDVASLVYAPCGTQRNLNINTELRVSAGSSNTNETTSLLTMDSADGGVSTVYHVAWKNC